MIHVTLTLIVLILLIISIVKQSKTYAEIALFTCFALIGERVINNDNSYAIFAVVGSLIIFWQYLHFRDKK